MEKSCRNTVPGSLFWRFILHSPGESLTNWNNGRSKRSMMHVIVGIELYIKLEYAVYLVPSFPFEFTYKVKIFWIFHSFCHFIFFAADGSQSKWQISIILSNCQENRSNRNDRNNERDFDAMQFFWLKLERNIFCEVKCLPIKQSSVRFMSPFLMHFIQFSRVQKDNSFLTL